MSDFTYKLGQRKEDLTYGYCCSVMRCMVDAAAVVYRDEENAWQCQTDIPGWLKKVPDPLKPAASRQQAGAHNNSLAGTNAPAPKPLDEGPHWISLNYCPFCGKPMGRNTANKDRLERQASFAEYIASRLMHLAQSKEGLRGHKQAVLQHMAQVVEEYYDLFIEEAAPTANTQSPHDSGNGAPGLFG